MANIFGVDENDTNTDTLTEDSSTDFSGLVLDLSDDDIEQAAADFKPIPAGTVTAFNIYELDVDTSKAGNPQWRMVLRTVEDTWGPNKQIRQTLTFSPRNKFTWAPFLKAMGMISGAGQVRFGDLDPQSLVGQTVMAKVQGYTWKDGSGSYQRSFGKGKQVVPNDGTPYYEELGNWTAYEPSSEDTGGLGEFSADDYI